VAIELTVPALLAQMGIREYNRAGLGTTDITPQSTIHHQAALLDAAKKRAAAIAPDADPLLVKTTPAQGGLGVSMGNMANHRRGKTTQGKPASHIQINPASDSAYYAHELGHAISQTTKAGAYINNARHYLRANPKLAAALSLVLPAALAGTGAALQEGDDDLAASVAIAAAAASPTLIDEALATKNALAIMNDAGIRANAGQRARLAGGYLSYLAPVIIGASVANAVGNVADDHVALYDL